MMGSAIGTAWSERFGLALAPLFEDGEVEGTHEVLLDGGLGTFALSTEGDIFDPVANSGWVWSGDMPHHVAIDTQKVLVTRWDRPREAQSYSRASVEGDLEGFYRYLTEDRIKSNRTVVEHLLGFFRRLRSLVNDAGLPDEDTTDVFTASLASLAFEEVEGLVSEAKIEKLAALNASAYAAAREDIRLAHSSFDDLRFQPTLAVRHASGQIFQEAHFELNRVGGKDLFGLVGMADAVPTRRGGAHFTPPALARIVVERSILELGDLTQRPALTICDPACGSGAFLYEAVRVLRRVGYAGQVKLIGRDISPSAISMAQFVLGAAIRDWSPSAQVVADLSVGDSLKENAMPAADLVIMNPPFISAVAQSAEQRARLEEIVGSTARRGDLSMAFINLAVRALNPEGVLGALFPASLLSLGAGKAWRAWLASHCDIRLLGSIGDFGVFSQALVQVACAVMVKDNAGQVSSPVGLLTGNDPKATGAAFRRLRSLKTEPVNQAIEGSDWSIFPIATSSLLRRETWKLLSPMHERILRRAEDANLAKIGSLFDVRQGVQTGLLKAFLLDGAEYRELPAKEQALFRDAVMTDSIRDGQIAKLYHIFWPYQPDGGNLFATEAELKSSVPRFTAKYLIPNQSALKGRAAIRRANRSDWWGLMHPREFAFHSTPKLVTKFFSSEGGFACDFEGALIPVTGHAWIPTDALDQSALDSPFDDVEIVAAYGALFNTSAFMQLVSCFAPNVSGGQYDLSARHVAQIPAPNLVILAQDEGWKPTIAELVKLGLEIDVSSSEWRRRAEGISARFYGGGDD